MAAEWSTDFADWSPILVEHRSSSPLEALMQARPYEEPSYLSGQQAALQEALIECFEQLSDQDRWVLEALWFERITVRDLAARLGLHKSRTHRVAQRAITRLGVLCNEHPAFISLQSGLQSSA